MLNVRAARPEDAGDIVRLIKGLAEFEREPEAVKITEEDVIEHGFNEDPDLNYFCCLMAERDGKVVGFALYFFTFSTWEGKPALYLEDIFILPEYRRRSVAKGLMVELAKIAVQKGCARFEWAVLDWNVDAMDFYHAMEGSHQKEWQIFRMEKDEIEALASTEWE
ncbi:MAG: GNAT family N-acetyltransferase [Deltaproteobacteria bacterium]|uniref:GNAT family N-acetyltransferase n=1 Tax=Candidatus Zymogenus saltonus TaxID=2844893 RepID=A0A9D8PRE7_9DELT|nr:GNAT family N-acetyltransferase [Candidatus Zymogenus saltonus]